MTDTTHGASPDRSATAAPDAVHERSFFFDVAKDAAAIVVATGAYDLGKAAAGAAVDKVRGPKHDDGPPPPSGHLDTTDD